MRYLRSLVAVAVIFAFPAASAMAHRAPTKTEKRALIKAYDRFIHFPVPAHCFTYRVSTVNPSWAVQSPSSKSLGRLPVVCAKFSVGRYLLHRTGGRWRVWAGTTSTRGRSRCVPVSKRTTGGSRLVLPLAVAKDLKIC